MEICVSETCAFQNVGYGPLLQIRSQIFIFRLLLFWIKKTCNDTFIQSPLIHLLISWPLAKVPKVQLFFCTDSSDPQHSQFATGFRVLIRVIPFPDQLGVAWSTNRTQSLHLGTSTQQLTESEVWIVFPLPFVINWVQQQTFWLKTAKLNSPNLEP